MKREAYLELYQSEDHHWWFTARRLIVQKVLDHYFPVRDTRDILEIGCASGGNFELLSKYGTLCAMELDDYARDMANRRGICLVEKGFLPNNIPFTETFDLICILDVLEHVDDDLGSLRAIREKLNPRGKLLVVVPAYGFLWSAHDITMQHKRRYGKKQLSDLIRKAGCNVVYSTYFNALLFPIIAVIRFIDNVLGKTEGTNVSMHSHYINALLTRMFASEKVLIPKMSLPFGVSILIVAENSSLKG